VKSACIDTHALVWYLTRPKRLGGSAARFLRDADRGRARVDIPSVVCVELALLAEAGRAVVSMAAIDVLLLANPAFRVLAMDHEQAREFSMLSAIADPFDRMIVAAARVSGRPLITADADIEGSSTASVIWD